MAKRVTLVSDLTGTEIVDDAVSITLKFSDARRGQYTLDAHPDDPDVRRMIEVGTKQARRGRRPRDAT